MKGAPQNVGSSFRCANNKLTSLEGAPKKCNWHFDCKNNKLTNLIGAPIETIQNFDCDGNPLTSVEGCPKKVGSELIAPDNKYVHRENFIKVCNAKEYIVE